jgi:hypothetical protein
MRSGRGILVFAGLLLTILSVSGCGGSSNNTNITSISITPTAASVQINTQEDFTATVTLANSTVSTNTAVTWQVNGTTGGSSSVGTIVSSSTDTNVGIYTAPKTVPTTNNGQVTITAIITVGSSSSSSSSSGTTITSNSATVTVTVGQGISVSPAQATVPAGGTYQFSALLNSLLDTNATWTVSSTSGGDIGSINPTTGLYTAPNAPPPGGKVTVTATDSSSGTAQTATAIATIIYSDASLRGPFAFSYVGDDSTGFRAVAGRLVADGAGTIQGGLEDMDSFGSPVASAVSIISGTYKVGPDGRTSTQITTSKGTETWEFVLTSTSHALLTRFDSSVTGHGTIDQQNLNDLTNSPSVISGNYVFAAFGGDATFMPMGVAGRFTADGAGGIPASASIVDENDNGTVKAADTSLSGSYSFDTANSGTGRGTLTLSSASTGPLEFAFYVVDNTHLYIVETDKNAFLTGEVYSGATGSSFNLGELSAANYVFTAGGNSGSHAYAAGGVFAADGNGNITSGTLDSDSGGTVEANSSISASTYTVDATTGRVDLKLGSMEFATYPMATGAALMLELDSAAISDGRAYVQAASPAALAGNFGLALNGQGVFYNDPGLYQSDAEGEAAFSGSTFAAGTATLDINNYGTAPLLGDPLGTSSSVATPSSNGRGTAVLEPTNPPATYNLVYYVIDANTAVLVGQDTTRVLNGIAVKQF